MLTETLLNLTRAVKLHRWETQLLGDISVLDVEGFINLEENRPQSAGKHKTFNCLFVIHTYNRTYRFAFDPFRGQGTRSDG